MKFKKAVLTILMVSCMISCTTNKTKFQKDRKFNPGHYVALNSGNIKDIKYIDDRAVIGVNKRYHWNDLEKDKGVYDFSSIKSDLEYLSSKNKQLIVFIQDQSYRPKGSLPEYLSEYEIKLNDSEFGCIRWQEDVINGWIKLGEAMAKEFNKHPNFEGIAVQETSLGLPDVIYTKYNYTPEKYRDALIKILISLKTSFNISNVFWYQNFYA